MKRRQAAAAVAAAAASTSASSSTPANYAHPADSDPVLVPLPSPDSPPDPLEKRRRGAGNYANPSDPDPDPDPDPLEKRRRGAGNYTHPSDPDPVVSPPDPLISVVPSPEKEKRGGETSGSPTEGAALITADPVPEALQVPPPEIQRITALIMPSQLLHYPTSSEIPKHFVIAFVNEFEKAHQYLRFKDHFLRLNQLSIEMAYQAKPLFPLLEDYDIRMAIPELERIIYPHYAKQREEFFRRPFQPQDPCGLDLNSVRNPIFYIAFRAHEQDYVPMTTPEEELFKLQKFAPCFYKNCAIHWEVPVDDKVKTVAVSNLSHPVSEIKIRSCFGVCGGIKHVEVSSKSQGTAYVIFKDFAGVLLALKYSGLVLEQVCEKTPAGYKALLVELKSVTDINGAESARRRNEYARNMYVDALRRYSMVRTYYVSSQSECGKVCGKEDFWGSCQWMKLESLANGWKTLEGNSWI